MPKLVALASVVSVVWGCAASNATRADSPASHASELNDGAAPDSAPQASPPDATPMPTPTPAAENELTDPPNSPQKLAQARTMGCVGIR